MLRLIVLNLFKKLFLLAEMIKNHDDMPIISPYPRPSIVEMNPIYTDIIGFQRKEMLIFAVINFSYSLY